MPGRRRTKRSRLPAAGSLDGSHHADDAAEDIDENSDDGENDRYNASDDASYNIEDNADDLLNETVHSVDIPVADDGGDGIGSDGIEIMQTEECQPSNQHWRGLILDEETGQFSYTDCDNEETEKDVPDADQYEKLRPRDAKKVRVMFSAARQTMVGLYKQEHDDLCETLEAEGIPKTIDGIYEKLYGKDSRFIQTLMRRLRKSYQEVCLFLSSHYLATELGLPPKRLEDHPNIDYKDYMDQKTLNGIWRLIERAGKDGNSPTYLWEDVEDALNHDCRQFFLRTVNRTGETRTYKLRIALDDDKIHHAFTTASIKRDKHFLCGAAGQRHVKKSSTDSL